MEQRDNANAIPKTTQKQNLKICFGLPVSPSINMHIPLTVVHIFLKVPIGRIWGFKG